MKISQKVLFLLCENKNYPLLPRLPKHKDEEKWQQIAAKRQQKGAKEECAYGARYILLLRWGEIVHPFVPNQRKFVTFSENLE